jgi:hypothetical protein
MGNPEMPPGSQPPSADPSGRTSAYTQTALRTLGGSELAESLSRDQLTYLAAIAQLRTYRV